MKTDFASVSSLMTAGVMVDLDASLWRARFKLQPEDVGIESKDVDAELLVLGRGWLAPKQEIRTIERIVMQARRALDAYSLPFPIGGARFVPVAAFEKVEPEFERVKKEFNGAVAGLVDRYDEMRKETLKRWKTWAQNFSMKQKGISDKSHFVETVLERVKAKLPNREGIASRFSFTWKPFQITIPTGAKAETVKSGEATAKLAAFQKYEKVWQEKVGSFVEETARALRLRVVEVARRTADVTKNRALRKPSVDALRTVIDEVRSLNFLGDEGLDKALTDLAEVVKKADEVAGNKKTRRDEDLLAEIVGNLDAIVSRIEEEKKSKKTA